jgi:hypothetical protein
MSPTADPAVLHIRLRQGTTHFRGTLLMTLFVAVSLGGAALLATSSPADPCGAARDGQVQRCVPSAPSETGDPGADRNELELWGALILVMSAVGVAWSLAGSSTDVHATFDGEQGVLRLRYERPLRRALESTHPLAQVSVRVDPGDEETRPTLEIRAPGKPWTVLALGPRAKLDPLSQRIRELVAQVHVAAPVTQARASTSHTSDIRRDAASR